MTRVDFLQLRSAARAAIRARDLLPREPYATWQDRDRAQQWVQACVGQLPGYAYARPYNPIDLQTRLLICAEFPQWVQRRLRLRERRQREAMRLRIQAAVAHLGPSVVEQNIAAARARSAA